jgi:hypothetical protein
MSYANRLDKLESVLVPMEQPLLCVVFGDEDADAAIARFRAERNWPDDGAHPLNVARVLFGKGPEAV